MKADPACVSCDSPRRWISVQRGAVASQKYTWPVVTGLSAIVTLAVKVITLPAVTVVTTPPADLTASVVAVALVAQAVAVTTHNSIKPAKKVIVGDAIRSKVAFMQEKTRLQDAGDESIGQCSPNEMAHRFHRRHCAKRTPRG
jgi:hypothetical protein